jgi:hypothetical protein
MLDASERSPNSFCSLFVVEDAVLFAVSIVAVLEQDARILNLLAICISAKDSDVLVITRNDCSTPAMVEIRMTNDQPQQSLAGEADAAKIFRDTSFRMCTSAASKSNASFSSTSRVRVSGRPPTSQGIKCAPEYISIRITSRGWHHPQHVLH